MTGILRGMREIVHTAQMPRHLRVWRADTSVCSTVGVESMDDQMHWSVFYVAHLQILHGRAELPVKRQEQRLAFSLGHGKSRDV